MFRLHHIPYPIGSLGGIESGIHATATENTNSHDAARYLHSAGMCFISVEDMIANWGVLLYGWINKAATASRDCLRMQLVRSAITNRWYRVIGLCLNRSLIVCANNNKL